MTKMPLIGGSQNGKEIEVPSIVRHPIKGAQISGNFETYLVEQAADGSFYAVYEDLLKRECTRCGTESTETMRLGDAIICEICWDDL